MHRFLVTGGAGFIGSNLVERLLCLGHRVRVVDNLSTGKFENIQEFLPGIDFICADLADPSVARRCVSGIDYVLHQAAVPSVLRSIQDPITSNHSIVTATVNLFTACAEAKTVKRIVQAASSSAYGDTPTLPKTETMPPNPISPYAVAKLTQELYARAFQRISGLEILSLRYFNIFGPRQDPDSFYSAVIPRFIKLMTNGRRPTIYGDGSTSRDFTYVDNVVEANLRACHCPWPGTAETINVGCGEQTNLNQLVQYLNEIIGTTLYPDYQPPRAGDVRHSLADLRKAQRLLDYRVHVDIRAGLTRLVHWHRDRSAVRVQDAAEELRRLASKAHEPIALPSQAGELA